MPFKDLNKYINIYIYIILLFLSISPPIQLAGRKLFISDYLLFVAWLAAFFLLLIKRGAGAQPSLRKNRFVFSVALLSVLFIISYGSGLLTLNDRIDGLAAVLGDLFINNTTINRVLFQLSPLKEAWNSLRTIMWWTLPVFLYQAPFIVNLSALTKRVQAIVLVLLPVAAAGLLSKKFHNFILGVYDSDYMYDIWFGREYLTQPSPMEAAMLVAGLVVPLVSYHVFCKRTKMPISWVFLGAFLIFSTKTLTLLFAYCLSMVTILLFTRGAGFKKVSRWVVPVGGAVGLLVLLAGWYWVGKNHDLAQLKWTNLLARFEAWGVIVRFLLKHPMSLFGGMGFLTMHTDNSILALLLRFGVLGLGVVGYLLHLMFRSTVARSKTFWVLIVFVAAQVMTFDVVLMRPILSLISLWWVWVVKAELGLRVQSKRPE